MVKQISIRLNSKDLAVLEQIKRDNPFLSNANIIRKALYDMVEVEEVEKVEKESKSSDIEICKCGEIAIQGSEEACDFSICGHCVDNEEDMEEVKKDLKRANLTW